MSQIIKKNKCRYCKSPLIKYYALRSIFYQCKNCQTIFKSNEEKFNFFNFFKHSRLNFFSSNYKNKKNTFLYFIDFIEDLNKKNLFKSKKVKFIELILKNYNKNNLRILDMSGAPGNDAQVLMSNKKVKKTGGVAITEYNKEIIKKINEHIKIKSFYLDYDNVEENNINEKYDIIIIWYSIYYCYNLEKLILLIKKIIYKNGLVIIASNVPNLACLTKFSIMGSYSPKYLWHYKLLADVFEKHNFSIIKKKINNGSNFISHYFLKNILKKKLYNLISIFLSVFYIFRNIKNISSYKKDIKLSDYICVFKKN